MNKYYLIGERLGQSCSPEIHRSFGRYEYELRELRQEELGPFLARRDFAGLNVTIPFKQAVIPFLDRLDPLAAEIGAVNTVVNRNGELWGYNTDFGGLRDLVLRLGTDPRGKTVLILGTGGTSKPALAVCRALGATRAFRVSRTGREGALTYAEASHGHGDVSLLINATPVGMWPDTEATPVDLSAFPRLAGVVDVIYNPIRTRLVLEALQRGIPAVGGLGMLVRQAALACEHFTGLPVEEEQVNRIVSDLRKSRENLVLIGMPGAGKTTLGRVLAQKLDRKFVDIDEVIAYRAGKPITAIFAEQGEQAFRALETAAVRELSQVGGRVIATGGGTILREENVLLLKQNGRLVFLDRPLERLAPSPDRPLGDTAEKVARLYHNRYFRYAAAADRRVSVTGTPEQTAEDILRELKW